MFQEDLTSVCSLSVYFQESKGRFSNPSTRGIMAGILHIPGPIATKITVKGLSRVFNNSVNIPKFVAAAKKLQDMGLGTLTSSSAQKLGDVFIKASPEEVRPILQMRENADLCTPLEYERRYRRRPPSTVSDKLKGKLVQLGLVPEHLFLASSPGVLSSQSPSGVSPSSDLVGISMQGPAGLMKQDPS